MKNSLHFLFALSLILCCVFITGCPSKTSSHMDRPVKHQKAEIDGTFLDGTAYNPEDYAGKVILLDFWATWCPHCIHEHAETLIPLYSKYHEAGLEIIGISCDRATKNVQNYTQQNGIAWKQMLESSAQTSAGIPLAEYYGVEVLPFPVLINRKGEVVAINLNGDEIAPAVEAELNKPKGSTKTETGKKGPAAETETGPNEAAPETAAEPEEE